MGTRGRSGEVLLSLLGKEVLLIRDVSSSKNNFLITKCMPSSVRILDHYSGCKPWSIWSLHSFWYVVNSLHNSIHSTTLVFAPPLFIQNSHFFYPKLTRTPTDLILLPTTLEDSTLLLFHVVFFVPFRSHAKFFPTIHQLFGPSFVPSNLDPSTSHFHPLRQHLHLPQVGSIAPVDPTPSTWSFK